MVICTLLMLAIWRKNTSLVPSPLGVNTFGISSPEGISTFIYFTTVSAQLPLNTNIVTSNVPAWVYVTFGTLPAKDVSVLVPLPKLHTAFTLAVSIVEWEVFVNHTTSGAYPFSLSMVKSPVREPLITWYEPW